MCQVKFDLEVFCFLKSYKVTSILVTFLIFKDFFLGSELQINLKKAFIQKTEKVVKRVLKKKNYSLSGFFSIWFFSRISSSGFSSWSEFSLQSKFLLESFLLIIFFPQSFFMSIVFVRIRGYFYIISNIIMNLYFFNIILTFL